jgi:hypothetical protein
LDEEIEDDISPREMDREHLRRWGKSTVGFFGAPREEEGKTGW